MASLETSKPAGLEAAKAALPDDAKEPAQERKEKQDDLTEVIDKEAGVEPTKNKTEVIASGQDFFRSLDGDIKGAKESIHINVFSFADDSSGQRIAQSLIEAKKQNPSLQIDLRVDRLGSFFVGSKDNLTSVGVLGLLPSLQQNILKHGLGANVSQMLDIKRDPTVLHSFPPDVQEKWQDFVSDVVTDDVLLQFNGTLRMLKEAGINVKIEGNGLSSMDHSKVFIIDGKTHYSGGMNVGDDYSGGYDAKEGWSGKVKNDYWKDYMVKMEGPASAIQRSTYFGDGSQDRQGVPDVADGTTVRVLHNKGGAASSADSFAKEKQITFATYQLLGQAQSEILLEHAYIMDQAIVNLLLAAADRGVSVKIVRSKPESEALENANEKFFSQLEGKGGVTIQRSPRVIHAKLLCVDGKYAIVGSANLTKESMDYHEETSLFFAGNDVQKQLDQTLDGTFADTFWDRIVTK